MSLGLFLPKQPTVFSGDKQNRWVNWIDKRPAAQGPPINRRQADTMLKRECDKPFRWQSEPFYWPHRVSHDSQKLSLGRNRLPCASASENGAGQGPRYMSFHGMLIDHEWFLFCLFLWTMSRARQSENLEQCLEIKSDGEIWIFVCVIRPSRVPRNNQGDPICRMGLYPWRVSIPKLRFRGIKCCLSVTQSVASRPLYPVSHTFFFSLPLLVAYSAENV